MCMAVTKTHFGWFEDTNNLSMLNYLRSFEKQYGPEAYQRLIDSMTRKRNAARLSGISVKLKTVSI